MKKRDFRKLADLMPVSPQNMSLEFRIKRGLRGAGYPEKLWNPAWLGPLDAPEIADLFDEPVSLRFARLGDHAKRLAARLGKTAPQVTVSSDDVRLPRRVFAPHCTGHKP